MAKKTIIDNQNYPKITPSKFLDLHTELYAESIRQGDVNLQPTTMLWGSPGIGKTQLIHQLADQVAAATGTRAEVHTVSLILMNPVDLRGIPVRAEVDGEVTARWATPEIFKVDPSPEVTNFIFFDEIPNAAPSVQAAAYQISLEHRIGEHVLPKNTTVICAGNRITDRAGTFKMQKPLSNRMSHFELMVDAEDWRIWALQHGIDPKIIGFIGYNSDYLNNFDPTNDNEAFPTPRAWELVNRCFITGARYARKVGQDIVTAMFPKIASHVSLPVATEFQAYVQTYDQLPTFDDIVSGKVKTCPKSISRHDVGKLYALGSMIASNVVNVQNRYENLQAPTAKKEIDDMLTIVGKFVKSIPSEEYHTLIMRDIVKSCVPLRPLILTNAEFKSALVNIAKYIV